MADSYRSITPELARRIKLVMTDVDGTIRSGSDSFAPVVVGSVRSLEEQGIRVGLVSGREILHLEQYASELGISGPLIAENGAIATMVSGGDPVKLGYSREPAVKALEGLQKLFPGAIEAGDWNRNRTMDLIVILHGVSADELRKHLDGADILDSGYVFHIIQKGISKGGTLRKIAGDIGLSPDEVMVFGDAPTDLSLFQSFPQSVLVVNPDITDEKSRMLKASARYVSDVCCGEGFAQVVAHVLSARKG